MNDLLLILPLGTNFYEIQIKIHHKKLILSYIKKNIRMSSNNAGHASLGLNELTHWSQDKIAAFPQTHIFLNEKVPIVIRISLKFVPNSRININHHWFR